MYSYFTECRGKVPYMSQSEAKLVLRTAQKKGTRQAFKGKVQPYSCSHCGYIHLGHRVS